MELQTKLKLSPQQYNQIDYDAHICLFGSCFAENISKKFDFFKFDQLENPFGILFHPKAIEKVILRSINEDLYTEKDIFFQNERWQCFEAHSSLSHADKAELLAMLNNAVKVTSEQIRKASHFIISLGSAWGYRFIEKDFLVANCHKLPQKKFLKELLSVRDMAECLDSIIALIKSVNPEVAVILTLSPVRHLKDGFSENALSKAQLLSAIHQVVSPKNKVHYFPSYEIMLDELRDYRFYREDMIHPNQTAINYIWERFSAVWICEPAQDIMKEVETIQKGLAHKPFNPSSAAHREFELKIKEKMALVQKSHPGITFK